MNELIEFFMVFGYDTQSCFPHCAMLYATVGEYFSDCKITTPNKYALDEEVAENLWKKSEEWTGLKLHK